MSDLPNARARGVNRGRGRGRGRGNRGHNNNDPRNSAARPLPSSAPSGAGGSTSDNPLKPKRVQKPPRPAFEGPKYDWSLAIPTPKLHYIRDCEAADAAIATLVSGKHRAVGFDIEWRPNFLPKQPENPVALVQLASEESIYLFQVTAMREFPESLRDFLGSSETLKVGVAINSDSTKLWRDHDADMKGCVDLSLLARTVDPKWTGKYNNPIGLAHLSETYLQRGLSKGKITRSDWQAQLTEAQQAYAANDAHAGFMIWKTLAERAEAMSPIPDPDWYTFSVVGGVLRDEENRPWFPFNPNYDPGPIEPKRVHATAASATVTLETGQTELLAD